MRLGYVLGFVVAPFALFLALLARPSIDESWENHPAHFWLVLGAAGLATALGWTISVAARRRRDARLFLISLAFVASSGFLGLHALATPGVLLGGPNAGFELATPFGLVVAGFFAAASTLELSRSHAEWVLRRGNLLLGALFAVMGAWAVISVTETGPLDEPLGAEQLDGWQTVLAVLGVGFYGLAGLGYFRLYRRRPERFVFAFAIAFALLAEAMVVIAWARNWQLSWWEWHVLMVSAFVVIGVAARSEWHEERFSPLYLDETLAGARDVSILFADLAGFTRFAERRDPTEVAAMLNTYFESLIPLLERAGGDVHEIAGDELMVVFEDGDHPTRAARAALLLQRSARRIADEHDDWPRFRVGVSSGEVLSGVLGGSSGHRKHGFVGDVVNLTARLQSEAPVDGVLISQDTFQRLDARAVVDPAGPLVVKGKEEPVTAYVLHQLSKR